MKDDAGRVTIDGFYDDVGAADGGQRSKAIDEIPDVAPALMKAFGFARPESPGRSARAAPQPADAEHQRDGGRRRRRRPGPHDYSGVGAGALDLRFVKGVDPTQQFDRLVAHVKKQGYFIVDKARPGRRDAAAHPLLASVTARSAAIRPGAPSMDTPIARAIAKALPTPPAAPVVRLPTIGGSAPFYLFSDVLKVPTDRPVDRQLRQQPARAEREPARAEPVGRHRSMAAILTMAREPGR